MTDEEFAKLEAEYFAGKMTRLRQFQNDYRPKYVARAKAAAGVFLMVAAFGVAFVWSSMTWATAALLLLRGRL
jgi:hypothetical protein